MQLHWTSGGGAVTCAELAATPVARLRGLLGRAGMASGTGLLIDPCNAVHTAFMRFAIDAVFLDRAYGIAALREALPPWRLACCLRAAMVLELPAGEAARLGLRVGDRCNPHP